MAKRTKPGARGDEHRAKLDQVFNEIIGRTDEFCLAHLDAEYADLSRMLAENLRGEPGAPLLKGTPIGWAAGIVYTVGHVNFLSDPSQTPHMKSADLYKKFGVSEATVQARARDIRNLYDLVRMDPRLSRKSRLDDNPLVWMFELSNGLIDDARRYPREAQEKLVKMGVIPYVHPDARGEAELAGTDEGDDDNDDEAGSGR